MSAPQNIVALIFDFDDTLTDDSTTKLIEKYGIDPREFWSASVKQRVTGEWDPTLAYLDLLLEQVGEGKPLGKLTNKDLREFGATLEFYKGLPDLFGSLKELVSEHRISRPSIEFYIISGGLEEIAKGSSIAKHFAGIWGNRFEERDGQIAKVKNVISFTEKTKYLFLINKGFDSQARTDHYLVNRSVDPQDRRVPFENMIYVGDGLTDVPCFSLIQRCKGKAFGVFDPARKDSPKKAWEQLVAPQRVMTMNSPCFGEKDDLGALIRVAVTGICMDLDVRSQQAV